MLLYIPKQLLIILNAEIVQQTPFNSNNNTNNYNIVRLQRRLFPLVFFFFLCLAQTKPKTIPHITHNFLHSSETLYYMPLNVSRRLIPPFPITVCYNYKERHQQKLTQINNFSPDKNSFSQAIHSVPTAAYFISGLRTLHSCSKLLLQFNPRLQFICHHHHRLLCVQLAKHTI